MSRTLPLSNFSSQSHLIGQSVFNQINWVLPGMIKSHLNSNSPDIVYKDTFSIEEMKRELENEVEEKLKMLDNSVSTTKAKVDSHLASIVEAKDALDEATKTCADTESRLKAYQQIFISTNTIYQCPTECRLPQTRRNLARIMLLQFIADL